MNENADYRKIAKKLIQEHENIMLSPYLCPAGKLTYGYGRNLEDKGLTRDEVIYALGKMCNPTAIAHHLLENDLDECIEDLKKFHFFKFVNEYRKAALIDFRYNVGPGTFRDFKLFIGAMSRGEYDTAADELENSLWYGQVKRRAPRIKRMIQEGKYYPIID